MRTKRNSLPAQTCRHHLRAGSGCCDRPGPGWASRWSYGSWPAGVTSGGFGDEAEAALAWKAEGRVGNDVAELVRAGIGPDAFTRLPGLTTDQAAAWRWAVAGRTPRHAVDRVVFLRALGLPDIPPKDLYRLEQLEEEDFRAWFAAGFDVPDMVQLIGLPLQQAISWRAQGYRPAQVQRLLQADRQLTVAEAQAFAGAGIVGMHQIDWIENGFAASDAVAYDEMDIQPNEARVWRSMGLRPADSQPSQKLPPGYERRGWTMTGETRPRDARHSVPDPPGTRGIIAEQSRPRGRRHRG